MNPRQTLKISALWNVNARQLGREGEGVQMLMADSSRAGRWGSEQRMLIWMAFCWRYSRLLMWNGGRNYKMNWMPEEVRLRLARDFPRSACFVYLFAADRNRKHERKWPENKEARLSPNRPPFPRRCVIANPFFSGYVSPPPSCICIFSTLKWQNCCAVV